LFSTKSIKFNIFLPEIQENIPGSVSNHILSQSGNQIGAKSGTAFQFKNLSVLSPHPQFPDNYVYRHVLKKLLITIHAAKEEEIHPLL